MNTGSALWTADRPWWWGRRLPIVASAALLIGALAWTMWLARVSGWPTDHTSGGWVTPGDLWRTFDASLNLVHGHLASIYGANTTLVTLPGLVWILTPVAAVVSVLGLGLGAPFTHAAHPTAWLVLGPMSVVLCCTTLFATDSWSRRFGVSTARRAGALLVQVVLVWNIAAQWGHPEDCLAVAALLWAVGAACDGRSAAAAWWIGSACAIQPLVLLALPVLAVSVHRRQLAAWLARVAVLPVLTVLPPLAANPGSTVHALVDQPNYPLVDHATPWVAWAPHLSSQTVAAGPGRLVALGLALAVAVPGSRLWKLQRAQPSGPGAPAALLWWMALALALRGGFESVMVAYNLWPPLVLATTSAVARSRLIVTGGLAIAVSTFANLDLHWTGRWSWWLAVTAGTVVVLVASGLRLHGGRMPARHRSSTGRLATSPWMGDSYPWT